MYPEDLNFVLLLNFLGVAALVFGSPTGGGRAQPRQTAPGRETKKLRRIAWALAWGLATYGSGIANAGGLVAAFLR